MERERQKMKSCENIRACFQNQKLDNSYGLNGHTVNASLISGLSSPEGIAFSGNDIFVANDGNGTIGEYTTSGATVNASLISGLNTPEGIAILGTNIFVANENGDTIGEYTTSGTTVNASLISGLDYPAGIAISGSDLFIENSVFVSGSTFNYYVNEYTTSGALVDAPLITGGLNADLGIAILGTNLFVANFKGQTVSEYTASGATVNASLISGLHGPWGIAIGPLIPHRKKHPIRREPKSRVIALAARRGAYRTPKRTPPQLKPV